MGPGAACMPRCTAWPELAPALVLGGKISSLPPPTPISITSNHGLVSVVGLVALPCPVLLFFQNHFLLAGGHFHGANRGLCQQCV